MLKIAAETVETVSDIVFRQIRQDIISGTLAPGAKIKLEQAKERGLSVVRWITAKDNETARRLYDRFAEKTKWVTYDLVP